MLSEQGMDNVEIRRDFIMGCLGNVIWFLCGGFFSGMSWIFAGLLCCCTIVGIPLGVQCFKFASIGFCPFGKEIEYRGGTISFIANIIWLVFCGIPMAVENTVYGCVLCITIIGIPFGLQFFKLAKLSLMPFGATITYL